MAVEIEQPIIGYEVVKPEGEGAAVVPQPQLEELDEALQRPDSLRGTTFKIKTPLDEHALYVTINDVVLNEGTVHESRRPFEVFVNSKNMDHFQWIVALTRIMSAVFRKGGDCTFLVDELRSVFDPRGGYFKKGGRFMPSIIAEIGLVLERHLIDIGMLQAPELSAEQKALIESKRAPAQGTHAVQGAPADGGGYPASAALCPKCHTKAVVQQDGCSVCLACSASRCS